MSDDYTWLLGDVGFADNDELRIHASGRQRKIVQELVRSTDMSRSMSSIIDLLWHPRCGLDTYYTSWGGEVIRDDYLYLKKLIHRLQDGRLFDEDESLSIESGHSVTDVVEQMVEQQFHVKAAEDLLK